MNAPPLDTPVAFFIYRRPKLARRVLGAIAQARPKRLLVVADGPAAPGDTALCRETRAVIEQVDWPCDVRTDFASTNLGLKKRFASGLDWVFSQVPEAIILEDDCLPEPTFFRFCSELLARFREDERVYMVRGANILRGKRFSDSSYYFSRFFHIWGWATWARAWKHYDVDMRQWPQCRDSGWLERLLPEERMVRQMRAIFEATHSGRHSTWWDYQWQFSGWLRNGMAVAPWTNLVTNIGFGVEASTTRDPHHPHGHLKTRAMRFPLAHPPAVQIDQGADRAEWDFAFPNLTGMHNLPLRLWWRLRRTFGARRP